MLSRVWPALCLWGAGLIHLASGAGSSPAAIGVILLGFGVIELAGGFALLRAARIARPSVILSIAVAAIGVSVVAALTGSMAWLPLVGSVAQLLIVAGIAAVGLRRRTRATLRRATHDAASPNRSASRSAARTIASFALCGALVSGLTTPALAATDAGESAVPHGTHSHHGG